jgi:dTDP-4-dehydrorhamnose reductase
MNVCILGNGTIGHSLMRTLVSDSIKIHLSSSREYTQDNLFNNKVFSYPYGEIAKIKNNREIEKCIITTRIDLLTKEQESLIYDDIKSLASYGCEFINLSSVSVYGSSLLPRKEEAEFNPVNKYGEMKMKIEITLNEIIQDKKLLNLRVANLFGKKGFCDLTNKAISYLQNNQRINIPSNHNLRDFIFYHDLEKFIEDWILNRFRSDGNMNFASGTSVSVEDWIKSIAKATKRSPQFENDFEEPLQYSVIDHQKLKSVWNRSITDTNVGLLEYVNSLN